MNLPNKLTISRIIMVPFILLFMLPISFLPADGIWNNFIQKFGMLIAIILFLIASITDTMDGQIARKMNMVTTMGKFLDPIADKMLVVSVLTALVQLDRITAYIVVITICRELIVSGVRLLAADKNKVIAAGKLGKIKTVFQVIAIIAEMVYMYVSVVLPSWKMLEYFDTLAHGLMWVAVILTVVSGYDYVKKNMAFLKE